MKWGVFWTHRWGSQRGSKEPDGSLARMERCVDHGMGVPGTADFPVPIGSKNRGGRKYNSQIAQSVSSDLASQWRGLCPQSEDLEKGHTDSHKCPQVWASPWFVLLSSASHHRNRANHSYVGRGGHFPWERPPLSPDSWPMENLQKKPLMPPCPLALLLSSHHRLVQWRENHQHGWLVLCIHRSEEDPHGA